MEYNNTTINTTTKTKHTNDKMIMQMQLIIQYCVLYVTLQAMTDSKKGHESLYIYSMVRNQQEQRQRM